MKTYFILDCTIGNKTFPNPCVKKYRKLLKEQNINFKEKIISIRDLEKFDDERFKTIRNKYKENDLVVSFEKIPSISDLF